MSEIKKDGLENILYQRYVTLDRLLSDISMNAAVEIKLALETARDDLEDLYDIAIYYGRFDEPTITLEEMKTWWEEQEKKHQENDDIRNP